MTCRAYTPKRDDEWANSNWREYKQALVQAVRDAMATDGFALEAVMRTREPGSPRVYVFLSADRTTH